MHHGSVRHPTGTRLGQGLSAVLRGFGRRSACFGGMADERGIRLALSGRWRAERRQETRCIQRRRRTAMKTHSFRIGQRVATVIAVIGMSVLAAAAAENLTLVVPFDFT